MSGARAGLRRIVAIGIGLAVALLLLAAGEAKAAKYAVAQCGWYVGADADWADTTGGVKFRPDAYCVPPPGADPFDGAHMKSFTREGQPTVSGTRFARWRWTAPSGTGITQIRGTWWHALHDGMEQRIGAVDWGGGFNVFAAAGVTDVTPRDFVAGFSTPMAAIEDRLLCARAESKSCSLDPGSWSAVRALTITLQDDSTPTAGIGGDLTAGGWRRGGQGVKVWGGDVGSGVRFGETMLDGARVGLIEYLCAEAMIGGEWRGTQMRPCDQAVSASQSIATTTFSDGPHTLSHCTTDFAGNVGCAPGQTVLIDNNPPAHVRDLVLAGGTGWHRVDDFDLGWGNPDQGSASPIGGASWRVTGPAGFDTGVGFTAGRNLASLNDLTVPGPGSYSLRLWLRDEAGNEAPSTATTVPLRFDNVPPGIAFESDGGADLPEQLRADVSDAHSGPAAGTISLRRMDSEQWTELSTKLQPGAGPDAATLVAGLPDGLAPGIYLFRADAVDGAGNTASTTRRADGTEMVLRKSAPPAVQGASTARTTSSGAKTRIFARLRWGHRLGSDVTVPFGDGAVLGGRLVRDDGAGVADRELRIVSRPSRGALARPRVFAVTTGPGGGFHLELGAGPSRRITVTYRGDAELDGATRPSLSLRVRGGIILRVAPRALRTGQVLRLGGRVRLGAAPIPRRGKLVAIQYYESATRHWRPVLVTRTDHSGRFHAHYRFRYVTGTARIRLRAVALPEERWPYAPGASRPVIVRVSG